MLIISSFISFYIVIDKKRNALNLDSMTYDEANKYFQFNHYLQIFINIYFVINAYLALEDIINNDSDNKERYNTQMTILVANVLVLISSFMYLPIMNSKYVLTR